MFRLIGLALLAVVLNTTMAAVARAQGGGSAVDGEKVKEAIAGASQYLLSKQHPTRGYWPEHPGQPGGLTGLVTLALLNAGQEADSEPMVRALNYLRELPAPRRTYAAAVQIMAFAAADPDANRVIITRNARWLEGSQITEGPRAGAWAYSSNEGRGDNSNTQFALLGLHEAERAGVKINPAVWRRSRDYFLRTQAPTGGWNYYQSSTAPLPYTGSMTCAGISSLIIASGKMRRPDSRVEGDQVICCGSGGAEEDAVDRAIEWLGRDGYFTLESNPGSPSGANWLYYLYALERIGRLSGRRFIGGRDWYREGAEQLLRRQDSFEHSWAGTGTLEAENRILSTAFALLFLSKGRRPVLMAKLKHGDDTRDWNRHRSAVANMVESVERRWDMFLTWQTIDARAASTADLLEAPVLFISGSQPLQLEAAQKRTLKEYVEQGGFVFAEANDGSGCSGAAFAQSFRQLMQELFPDSPLRLLPADHPVWFAERKVDFDHLPHGDGLTLEGVEACCRTSVVLCNKTLSGYWELSTGPRRSDYSDTVQRQVEASLALGQNILAYATNRQLKEKLDRPQMALSDAPPPGATRATLVVPKLSHGGGAGEAPNALPNLLQTARAELQMRVLTSARMLAATDPDLADHPVLFMHGRRPFRFSAAERTALRSYLENGGFVFVNAICASEQFAQSVRAEFEAIVPEAKFSRVPPRHRMFSTEFQGFNLSQVTVRSPRARGEDDPLDVRLSRTTPLLEGLELDGRLCVLFSPLDISCALENQPSLECEGYVKDDALKLGINVILFALQQ